MLIINNELSKKNFQTPALDYQITFYGYQMTF